MSIERYTEILEELCVAVGLANVDHILETRRIEVDGFDVQLDCFENDLDAIYANFDFGTMTAGRSLVVFRLMLEANLLIYAQDQAQLGLNGETGGIILVLRIPFDTGVTGSTLANLLVHYAEHGRYWRKNILEANDEMYEGIASGKFYWIRV